MGADAKRVDADGRRCNIVSAYLTTIKQIGVKSVKFWIRVLFMT